MKVVSQLMASGLSTIVVDAVFCPVHGLGRLVVSALVSLVPGLTPASAHTTLVNVTYRVLTGLYGQPAVPSMRFFELRAEALTLVHQAGVTLSLACLVAPLVSLWAREHYCVRVGR